MRLIDIVNGPWAITPDMLGEIQTIYKTHLRGEKIDIAAVEDRLGRPLKKEPQGYQVVDGVALFDLDGPIMQRANIFTQVSGGISLDLFKRDVSQAMADPQVKGMIFIVGTPGGVVSGVSEASAFLRSFRGQKPMYTWTESMIASAGIWLFSATDGTYISSEVAMTGSVSIVVSHVDVSEAEKMEGKKTSEITSGPFKRIDSRYSPLTPEGRAYIESQIQAVHVAMVNDIAANLNMDPAVVQSQIADGRMFVGSQAIEAGLVDGVSTLEALIARINQQKSPAGVARAANKGAAAMNIETLRAENPDLVAQIEAAAREGYVPAADLQTQIEAAASAERARIQAVESQLIPGHEALINTLKFDGKTNGDQAAAAVVAAEKGVRTAHLAALETDSGVVVPAAEGGEGSGADPAAPVEERAKAQWDKDADLRAEFGGRFESFLAYRKTTEAGNAKILGKK